MLKQPAPSIPGMTDTLDFVKNLWGSMNIPGANMPGMSGLAGPPLSIEDLDKRIADMKAVESWLNLNLTMLRGTIQALEVQRGTLATLRSMSSSMAEAMRQSGVSAEKMANMPFASFFSQPGQGAAKPAAPAAAPQGSTTGSGSAQPGAAPAGQASSTPPSDAAGAAAALGMPQAMAWWNMLQEQFTQAVTTAMTPAAGAAQATAKGADGDPAAAAPADKPGPAASDAPPAVNGNGRARGGRPKGDKA
jgi:hypothetical protein